MSVTVMPNTGILGDDRLDSARGVAIMDLTKAGIELPESLIYYIRDLERALIDVSANRRKVAAGEIWSFANLNPRKGVDR